MSKIEIVSTFEYQVWNMRRWFSLNAVSIMLFTVLGPSNGQHQDD